jgi:hypothetical protein
MGVSRTILCCPAGPLFQVHKFLDKNHDQVRQDVLDLFVRSRTRVSKPDSARPLVALFMAQSLGGPALCQTNLHLSLS